MNELVYLEPNEEITSVIDRLKKTQADALALVIPRGASIAQSIVNLKLLKKSAEELEKEISLVATDRITRNLASQIGITVYSKVSEAERSKPRVNNKSEAAEEKQGEDPSGNFRVNNYYRNKSSMEEEEEGGVLAEEKLAGKETKEATSAEDGASVLTRQPSPDRGAPASMGTQGEEIGEREIDEDIEEEREDDEDIAGEPEFEHREIRSSRQAENKNIRPHMSRNNVHSSRKPLLVIALVFIAIIGVLAYLFLPFATISIKTKADDLSFSKAVTVDKNINSADVIKPAIPGTMVEIEKEAAKDFDATGKKDMGEKSSGTLSFRNDAGVDDTIPSGTIVKSSTGLEFQTTDAISVSKASLNAAGDKVPGKADGKVTAQLPGAGGNLPSSMIYTVTGKEKVTAVGATTGGITKEVAIVSDDDLTKAEAALKDEITTAAKTDLSDKAKLDRLVLLDNVLKSEVISSGSSKNVGDQTDKFNYKLKLKVFTLGFSKSSLDDLMMKVAQESLPKDKMVINPDKADIGYTVSKSDIDSGTLLLDAKYVGKSGKTIDTDQLKAQIKNKSVSGAKQFVESNYSVISADLKISPSFIGRVPFLTSRIKVDFGYDN